MVFKTVYMLMGHKYTSLVHSCPLNSRATYLTDYLIVPLCFIDTSALPAKPALLSSCFATCSLPSLPHLSKSHHTHRFPQAGHPEADPGNSTSRPPPPHPPTHSMPHPFGFHLRFLMVSPWVPPPKQLISGVSCSPHTC